MIIIKGTLTPLAAYLTAIKFNKHTIDSILYIINNVSTNGIRQVLLPTDDDYRIIDFIMYDPDTNQLMLGYDGKCNILELDEAEEGIINEPHKCALYVMLAGNADKSFNSALTSLCVTNHDIICDYIKCAISCNGRASNIRIDDNTSIESITPINAESGRYGIKIKHIKNTDAAVNAILYIEAAIELVYK